MPAAKRRTKRRPARATTGRRLPLSGSEPVFTEIPWGTKTGIVNNNCYSYSLNDYSSNRPIKAAPGDRAGYNSSALNYRTCKGLSSRLLADNPGHIYHVKQPGRACNKGYFKIMMFVSSDGNGEYGDFHFYRQNKDIMYTVKQGDTLASIARFFGTTVKAILRNNEDVRSAKDVQVNDVLFLPNVNAWSHKLGHATGALIKDSCGRLITDPRKACRKHAYDYDTFCGAYCVRKGHVRSSK